MYRMRQDGPRKSQLIKPLLRRSDLASSLIFGATVMPRVFSPLSFPCSWSSRSYQRQALVNHFNHTVAFICMISPYPLCKSTRHPHNPLVTSTRPFVSPCSFFAQRAFIFIARGSSPIAGRLIAGEWSVDKLVVCCWTKSEAYASLSDAANEVLYRVVELYTERRLTLCILISRALLDLPSLERVQYAVHCAQIEYCIALLVCRSGHARLRVKVHDCNVRHNGVQVLQLLRLRPLGVGI